jgi:predicted nucleic acid-binding protein
LTLDEIKDGLPVFIDANIFIYHFTGISEECSRFLERCERGSLKGTTTVQTVLEVIHRLMTIEAVHKGFIQPGNTAGKLKKHPEIVRGLSDYTCGLKIPAMGIQVIPCSIEDCRLSQKVREKHGLLTNDSLLIAAMQKSDCINLITSDTDFDNIEEITVFKP